MRKSERDVYSHRKYSKMGGQNEGGPWGFVRKHQLRKERFKRSITRELRSNGDKNSEKSLCRPFLRQVTVVRCEKNWGGQMGERGLSRRGGGRRVVFARKKKEISTGKGGGLGSGFHFNRKKTKTQAGTITG